MEHWLNQKKVHEGPVFTVWSGDATLDDGTIIKREVVRHQGSVAIVPVIADSVILVRQFRITIGREVLEIPAGRIEAGETPAAAAARELEEETGYQASRLVPGPSYFSSVGFVDEQIQVFFAFGLVKTKNPSVGDEKVSLEFMPLSEIEQYLHSYRFDDSKTIIGLRELLLHLKTKSPMLDDKTLYQWYSDENHKYNTIIWQFPAAIVGLNILAFEKIQTNAALLLSMWLLNNVLLYCVAKHVYHQRCFTNSLQLLNKSFQDKFPELHFVEFKRDGINRLFRFKATWVLMGALFLFNVGYLVAAVWMMLGW